MMTLRRVCRLPIYSVFHLDVCRKNLSSDDYVSCFKLHSGGSVLYFPPYIMIYMPKFEQGGLTKSRSFHFCCNCCEDIIIQHQLQNFLLHFNEDFTRRVGLGSFFSSSSLWQDYRSSTSPPASILTLNHSRCQSLK